MTFLTSPSQFAILCAKTLNDEKFGSLTGNESQVEYIFKNVKSLQEFREEASNYVNKYREDHKKSVKSSVMYRAEGDIFMAAQDYGRAVQQYSYALVNAPFPTEGTECKELQKCYTARSKAFMAMQNFENALFDTEKSLFLGTSLDMLVQKAQCLRAVRRFGDAKMLIDGILSAKIYWKLSERPDIESTLKGLKETVDKCVFAYGPNYAPHEDTPKKRILPDYDVWVDHRFEIKETESKGRTLVVKEKIPKDEIIIAEKPENAVLTFENMLTYCHNCFEQIGYKFWPCVWCNEVVFCNRQCHDRGLADFHYYECTIAGLLVNNPLYQVYRSVTRIGAEKAFEMGTKEDREPFDYKKWLKRFYCRDTQPVYRANMREERVHHFEALLGLTDHNDSYSPEENVKQSLLAIETALLVENKDQFKTYDPKKFTKFVAFLVKMFRKTLTNSFAWGQPTPYYHNRLGSCIAVYASLLNHSCLPNSYWQFIEDKILFRTTRDIEEGEEITISYGPNPQMPLNQRQMILRNHYHFVCKCDFCKLQVSAFPALKCLKCEGPVLFVPNAIKPDVCLDCDTKYDNIIATLSKVSSLRLTFDEETKRVEVLMTPKKKTPQVDQMAQFDEEDSVDGEEKPETSHSQEAELEEQPRQEPQEEPQEDPEEWRQRMPEIEASLALAEEALKSIIDLHYSKVDEIFDLEMKIGRLYVKVDRFDLAIPHFERITSSTDWSKCGKSCRHWDDLLFITNAYFSRLSIGPKVTKKAEWKHCFKSFLALKASYKTIKANDKALQLTKSLTIDGKPAESGEAVKAVMREKKANFEVLKDVYKKLFTAWIGSR